MGRTHCYYVYILASKSRNLYTGVTNDIYTRTWQHKQGTASKFTSKYRVDRLVYYEEYSDIEEAILREKTIKGWVRSKKVELICSTNPTWDDLSSVWDFRSPFQPNPAAIARRQLLSKDQDTATADKQQVLRSAQDDKS